eukprot:2308336-Prymnesium_polylepis.1
MHYGENRIRRESVQNAAQRCPQSRCPPVVRSSSRQDMLRSGPVLSEERTRPASPTVCGLEECQHQPLWFVGKA